MRPISYELNGFPEFLRSEQACRRAIERGALSPETPIVAYGEDGERRRMLAKDHSALGDLFAGAAGLAAPPPAPPPPPPVIAEPVPVAPPSPFVSPRPEVTSPPEPSDAPFRAPAGEGSGKLVGIVILLVVIGLVLIAIAALGKDGGTSQSSGGETVAENMASMADGSLTNETLPAEASQTLYAVRDVIVRTGPSAGSSSVGLVQRGAALIGVPGDAAAAGDSGWLRITEGEYRDRFAPMANLASAARPDLDTDDAGTWYVTQALTPLEEPTDSAPRKTGAVWQLASGAAVDVVGTTGAGAFSTGWAEVRLERESGVGYVPLDRLTRTQPTDDEGLGDAEDGSTIGTDTAGATESGAILYLESACRREFDVVLRVRGPDGMAMDSAHLPANATTPFQVDGSIARLMSNEAYYANLAEGGDAGVDGVTFRGRAYRLSRLRTVRDSQGNLHARFTC